MLKRNLAPLTQEAWNEIDARAGEVLKSRLAARKAVNVNGPKGWNYTALSEGRVVVDREEAGEVKSGIFQIKPLVESRMTFTLNRWEMDNIIRGAKDIDLSNLEEAAKKIADFEENTIYNGYEAGTIQGLKEVSAHKTIDFGNDGATIMEALSQGLITLRENYAQGPLDLIVGKEAYKRLNKEVQGYPLIKRVEKLIGGSIIFSNVLEGAMLVPHNHEDLEFTIGQDFAIGYESHDDKEVTLFITETFTFRVLDENIIITFNL